MFVSRVVLPLVIVSLFAATPAAAQSPARVDIAGQVVMLRLTDLESTSVGLGGRLTVNLSRWVAIDGEINLYPSDDATQTMGQLNGQTAALVYQRRRTDGYAGIKLGHRGDRMGVFAKARPGFTRLTHEGVGCGGDLCALILIAPPAYQTEFAFDLGGIVEFYPSSRVVARFDFGDTMIRNRPFAAPPCEDCTTHNFTSRLGVGFSF